MDNVNFEEFFAERMRERGYDPKKLSEISGIAKKHINALISGNFNDLPPEPYSRGYLLRLGELLEFDAEAWWRKLKDGGFIKSSGEKDKMAKNRFLAKRGARVLWISATASFVILYAAFQLPRALGRPEIILYFPEENPAVVSARDVNIVGVVKNASELYIENEPVSFDENGGWSKIVSLAGAAGANDPMPIRITAKKFLGRETSVVQQIIYRPAPTSTDLFGAP